MISSPDFDQIWLKVTELLTTELLPNGLEGVVFMPLARLTPAATMISRWAFSSDDSVQRKISAGLAGYIIPQDTQLLAELFELEAARDASGNFLERLYCQSVVEDLVFSAARWCRNPKLKSAGLAFLVNLIERTLNGQYWSANGYAMLTLFHHSPQANLELLNRFEVFTTTAHVNHPSRPSLQQERQIVEKLKLGSADLKVIENLLNQKDQAVAAYKTEPYVDALIDKLLAVASKLT